MEPEKIEEEDGELSQSESHERDALSAISQGDHASAAISAQLALAAAVREAGMMIAEALGFDDEDDEDDDE